MNYLTGSELRKVADLVEALNAAGADPLILGAVDVYDSNGEVVGKISYQAEVGYVFVFGEAA